MYLYPYSVSMIWMVWGHLCVFDICLLTGWLPSWPFSLQLWYFPLRHNKGVDFFSLNLSPSFFLLLFLTAAFCNKIHQHHQLLGLLLPLPRISLFLSFSPRISFIVSFLSLFLPFVLIFLSLPSCLPFYLSSAPSASEGTWNINAAMKQPHKQLLWGCWHMLCTHTNAQAFSVNLWHKETSECTLSLGF